MKKLNFILFFIGCITVSCIFNSCKENDEWGDDFKENSLAPEIMKVFLEDQNSTVRDREVSFARLGQTIRLEGANFIGVTKVFINGYNTYFNPVFASNKSMIVQIKRETPIIDADPSVKNKIQVVKGNQSAVFNFDIRAAAPSITGISHTMPLPGEWITVEGSGLVEISRVVFPDNIEVTADIIQGEDGKSFRVKVPNGISENGGSIFIECSNGGTYSPAYFNCKIGLILDFDGHGNPAGWTDNAIKSDDFLSEVIGEGNVSQGKYCPLTPDKFVPISAGAPRATEVWTTGSENWRELYVPNLFSESTPLDKIAFQFDLYVPEFWNNSGFIGINLANNFAAGNQWTGEFYNYIPWLVGSEKVPFKTLGWTTITIPLNKFYKYAKEQYTFNDILAFREAASNKNFGLFFNNNDFTLNNITKNDADKGVEFPSSATSVKVYVDNFRLVSLVVPAYSDFSD